MLNNFQNQPPVYNTYVNIYDMSYYVSVHSTYQCTAYQKVTFVTNTDVYHVDYLKLLTCFVFVLQHFSPAWSFFMLLIKSYKYIKNVLTAKK